MGVPVGRCSGGFRRAFGHLGNSGMQATWRARAPGVLAGVDVGLVERLERLCGLGPAFGQAFWRACMHPAGGHAFGWTLGRAFGRTFGRFRMGV